EQTAQCDATVFNQYTVISRDVLRCIGCQRIFQSFDSALIARRVQPGAVRINRVSRNADDIGADVREILVTIAEGRQFGRANKSEVKWIENENKPLAAIIGKLHRLVEFLDILR